MLKLKHSSIGQLFFEKVAELGEAPFLARRSPEGKWVSQSWNTTAEQVRRAAKGLLSLGVEAGDRIGLFSPNRVEWGISDLAVLCTGAADVPIYATNSAPEARYVLENSESRMCFAAGGEQLERILEAWGDLPLIEWVISLDPVPDSLKRPKLIDLDELMKKGDAFDKPELLDQRIEAVQPEDLATLIYTSGTTGNPKGVMLTHRNFLANVEQAYLSHPKTFARGDRSLSFLPLSHALERTAGWYLMMYVGGTIHYARSPKTVAEDLKEVRPQFLVSVPRLFEKVYAGIHAKVEKAPALRQKIFHWALGVGRRSTAYTTQGQPMPFFLDLQHKIASKLVFDKLAVAIGADQMKVLVSGGGPLAQEINEFFHSLGMVVHEGYGLTETTPIATVNSFTQFRFGSVGAVVPDTEVKIAADGEILIRGPQVMKGYWKRPDATAEVLDEEGWFSSGDIGVLEDGFLRITDRKKELIITAGGKNISPAYIENAMVTDRYIDKVAVIGDRRPYLVALVVPAFEALEEWASAQGIPTGDHEKLIQNDKVQTLYDERIRMYNKSFGRVEQIKRFELMPAEFTQETGELTPTLKLKRRVIQEKYGAVIDGLYAKK